MSNVKSIISDLVDQAETVISGMAKGGTIRGVANQTETTFFVQKKGDPIFDCVFSATIRFNADNNMQVLLPGQTPITAFFRDGPSLRAAFKALAESCKNAIEGKPIEPKEGVSLDGILTATVQ